MKKMDRPHALTEPRPGARMAETALQVLRWLIGWHFLYEGVWKLFQAKGWSCLSYLDGAQGPLAGLFTWMAGQGWLVAFGDQAVMWGLVLIGLALITGVFARAAAVFGMLLMAMFYCAQPPEPFAAAVSGADGRFLLLERNALEALGLLLVAVMPCRPRLLRTLLPGALVLALFAGLCWRQKRVNGFEPVAAVTSATVKVHEFTALAALKAPFAERTELAGVRLSPLALGGDFMAGHAHARDLIWTDEFMRRYHAAGTLERTVRYCSLCGIDAVFAEPAFCARICAAAKEVGGEMKFFADCATEADAAHARAAGAAGVYLRPERADALAKAGDAAGARALVASLRKTGLPVGIGAEDVATVKFFAGNGLAPDFWALAFHSLDYPAATMKPRCNNIWCEDPKAAAAYMKTRSEPWVAIRCLAGGALDPAGAYRFARAHGAAVAAIDLLDFRVVETVNGVAKKEAK